MIRSLVDGVLEQLSPRFNRLYARAGRPSIAPEKLLRALILQLLYSVRSERQLMERRTHALLRDPRALGQVAAVTAVCCLVEVLLLPGAPEYRGFLAGALAASVVWMPAQR